MKILIIHNEYQIPGGEDAVVEKQFQTLMSKGFKTKKLIINNLLINEMSKIEKIQLLLNNCFLFKCDKKILEKLDDYKPDIVHMHNVFPLINPRIYYEINKRGIKIVQTLHNYRLLCPNGLFFTNGSICEECIEKKSYYRCFSKKCYRDSRLQSLWYARIISLASKRGYFKKIDHFIALNGFMKDKLVENGYAKEKFSIVPNGINDESLIYNKPINDYYLYIGRLSSEKGIKTLCESFSGLDFKLKIIGTGPEKDYVDEAVSRCTNIEYLGFKSGNEKNKLISQAKAIIVPSEWYENLPTVIIEAFMNGTPTIVSKLGGAQYMVEEDVNGTKFNAGDKSSLIDAINRLELLDYSELRNNARETFLTTYESFIVTKDLINLYNKVLNES